MEWGVREGKGGLPGGGQGDQRWPQGMFLCSAKIVMLVTRAFCMALTDMPHEGRHRDNAAGTRSENERGGVCSPDHGIQKPP